MTVDEASKILAVITNAYPRRINHDDGICLVRLWAAAFADVPYKEVGEAVMRFIRNDTKGYMPVPGQIYELVVEARRKAEGRRISDRFYSLLNDGAICEEQPDGHMMDMT